MARVFISHSSRDDEYAAEMKTWLEAHGFEQIFLDFDANAGIDIGADWEKTLYREIERCHALIVILTPNWLESKWCFAEFTQARALGKPVFPVIETPSGDTIIAQDIQHLDLTRDREGGLRRLAARLTEITLDAQGQFEWDAQRPPYPGLLAFEEEDAAIYFGRDDDIRHVIERLNARRVQGGGRLVALLGASGSGKSSLLRAGVLPRLKRDQANWIVLPPFRPQVHPIDEFARAISLALDRGGEWREVREQLRQGDLRSAVADLVHDLRIGRDALNAQVLVTIDQAEELFTTVDGEEGRQFFEHLTTILTVGLPVIVIAGLRSDYLGYLQTEEHLQVPLEEISLKPMPLERVQQIIRGPAQIAGTSVEDALIGRATRDAETEDALPLLAFALRELHDRFGGDGELTLAEYEALGDAVLGLTALENAVRRAADDVLETAAPSEMELRALRDAFVPAMVRVNSDGEFVRRTARWDSLPKEAHRLLEQLAKARLLILRQDGDARVVEVSHEALLRKWPRLSGWLNEERDFLIGKGQIEQDVADWECAPDPQKDTALLTGFKLNRAEAWLTERPHQLSEQECTFVSASIERAQNDARRRNRLRRIVTWGSAAAVVIVSFVSWWAYGVVQERNIVRAEVARTDIRGEIVAFATAKGQFALDTMPGEQTSPYTSALLSALADRDKSMLAALTALNQQVMDNSKGHQRPFLATSMNGDIYLWKQPRTRERLAFVVSVDKTSEGGKRLTAPKHDADAFARLLRTAGYSDQQIVRLHNPDPRKFLAELEQMLSKLQSRANVQDMTKLRSAAKDQALISSPALKDLIVPAGLVAKKDIVLPRANTLVLFYFSGDGAAASDGNYLIMESDRAVRIEADLEGASVKLEQIITKLSMAVAASVLVLDTNFPFAFQATTR